MRDQGVDGAVDDAALRVLQRAARLMLEYNERSTTIENELHQLAKRLGIDVSAAVSYRECALTSSDGRVFRAEAPELRINMAVSVGTMQTLDGLRAGRLAVAEAATRLESVERTSPRHGQLLVAALFGLAACALARLLGADAGAVAVSGASAGLGLIARRKLANRTTSIVAAPFTAGLIGALAGGLVIRMGWTLTPNLCLIVPALMLVPGPHLINSLEEMFENQMQSAVARFCLAVVILFAAALGVVAGAALVLDMLSESGGSAQPISLPVDMALAGIASLGFGAFYNSPWPLVWVSIASGMAGHGIRYLGLEAGLGLATASLAACLVVGVLAGIAAARWRLPFSSVAFAGAVPMMPGVLIYESIADGMRLAAAGTGADPALAVATLSPFLRAGFVVAGMTIGLIVGARIAAWGVSFKSTARGR